MTAQTEDARPQDLKKLSIEELAQVDVTSVSRRPEPLSHTAAAVSVISSEDIRRSGTVVLAEAMRLGAAVDVGRVNGGTWGISTRGFNISTANKLLVLVDGGPEGGGCLIRIESDRGPQQGPGSGGHVHRAAARPGSEA